MNFDIKNAFVSADKSEEKFIDFWRSLCLIESPTHFKAGVDKAVEFIKNEALKIGFDVKEQKEKISGSPICITMNKDAKGKPIAFSGHIDTVHPVGAFGSEIVRVDNENIYGPGVFDCKGGVVAAFYAMTALADSGFSERPIKLIIQTDEETSSLGSNKRTVDFMYESAKNCCAFINLEPHTPGDATLIRKGIISCTVKVTGIAAHASYCFAGVSAIKEAAHKIIELEKLQDENGITFSCGMISGGTSKNTVAEECNFTVDIRFTNNEERVRAANILERVVKTSYLSGSNAEIVKKIERCAMEENEQNKKLLASINSAFSSAGLPLVKASKSNGGSDASDITSRGLPCIDSLGVSGGGIHSKDEFARLTSLKEACYRVIAISANL